MLFKTITIGFMLLCMLCSAGAQGIVSLTSYGGENGPSHRAVSSMVKDKDGFMWFGTWNGINRFDGKTFKTFDSTPVASKTFPLTRRVIQVLDDPRDRLWVLTYDEQIYWFDKKTERFHSLSQEIRKVLGSGYNITEIFFEADGYLWLGTASQGLIVCRQDEQGIAVLHLKKDAPQHLRLRTDVIKRVHKGADGRIWVGTDYSLSVFERAEGGYQGRECLYDKAGRLDVTVAEGQWGTAFIVGQAKILLAQSGHATMQEFSMPKAAAALFSAHGSWLYVATADGALYRKDLNSNKLTLLFRQQQPLQGIFEDSKGNLWLDRGFGVLYLERSSNRTTLFHPKYPERNAVVPFYCFEDANERVWVSMKGGGFGYYDEERHELIFSSKDINADRLDLPQYNSHLFYDNSSVVWFTSEEQGLVKMIFPSSNFAYHDLFYKGNRFVNDEVRSLLSDAKGRLWIGTKRGDIYSNEEGKDGRTVASNLQLPQSGGIYSMLEDQQGHLWLGTKGAGLFKTAADGEGHRVLAQFHKENKLLDADQVYALAQDRYHNIWIGTFDNGLFKLEQGFGEAKIKKIIWRNLPKGSRRFNKIRHLMIDAKENLWVATTEGLVVQGPRGDTRFFYDTPPGNIRLGDNDIQHIFSDLAGNIYLCTSGGGLTQVVGDPFNECTFTNYGIRDGLQNGFIVSGIADEQGMLWLSTEAGLINYDSRIKKFFNSKSGIGLRGISFSEKAVSRSAKNHVFWGTRSGVLELKPKSIRRKQPDPQVVFTKLLVNNEERDGGQADQPINIQYLDQLVLRHNENNLSIDFAITDYQGSPQHFAYRLLGLDSLWQQNGSHNRATFTNLQPGTYRFEIRCEDDLYGAAPFRALQVVIRPAWWATWWAYLLYVAVVAGAAMMARQLIKSLWTLKQKVEIEKKLAAVKMQFFTHVSHELRTPLTLIMSPASQLLKRQNISADERQYMELISRNAQRMQRFVDQLLDLRQMQEGKFKLNKQSIDIVETMRSVVEGFEPLAKEKQVTLSTVAPAAPRMLFADKSSVEIILYNLLSNAIKYTAMHSRIEIALFMPQADGCVKVVVDDQGPGVAEDELESIFNLFHVGTANCVSAKSSGIGLHLSKELVALHGGSIWARNKETGGLEVSFTLAGQLQQEETAVGSSLTVLQQAIREQLQVELGAMPGSAAGEPQEELLLVEDNEDLRRYLAAELGSRYKVLQAADGEQGLAMALQHVPDLVVSDVMMPGLDGIELVSALRANERSSHIPIILLSAKHAIETQIAGLDYGADFYITKPFNLDFLLASIKSLLRKRRKLFDNMVNQKDVAIHTADVGITEQDRHFLQEVIRIVEEKMVDPELSIDTLAEAMNLGRNTFYKKFKNLTDLAPVEFVRDMRLEKAKAMLDQGMDNITEVAYQVGFNNPKYFSTCFREKFGASPKKYALQSR